MKVATDRYTIAVTREPGDQPMRGGSWGTAESQLLYHVKKVLATRGYDLVKRRTQADGHLFGDERTVYLRDRRRRFCIFDGYYAIRDAAEAFNAGEEVVLSIQGELPEGL